VKRIDSNIRVAMLIEGWKPVWGGGQVHVWELSKQLARNYKVSIDLFVMNLGGESEEEPFKGLRIHKMGHHNNFNLKSRIKWCFQAYKAVKEKHREERYDLIHAHANLPGFPAKVLSKRLGIPVVYTVHGSGLKAIKDMYGEGLKCKIIYWIEKIVQTKIKYDAEISVDHSFLRFKNVNKPVIIPNGVDVKKFDAVKGRKGKNFKVIFVGRLHPQKGLKYLIKAVGGLKDKAKNLEICLVGKGTEEEDLKGLVERLSLKRIVKFKGAMYGEKLIKEYKSSHLFVLPSLYEGQPLTLLEAWAAKLPVLVTDVGGNGEFVRNNENGWLIKPKKVRELREKLLLISKMPKEELRKMGLKGYCLVKEKYNWEKVAEETLKVYQDARKK